MSLRKQFFKTKFTYKIYLYYHLYFRHRGFIKKKHYSQWGEDMFIIDFFKDKPKGVYLDIGCFHPFHRECLRATFLFHSFIQTNPE